MECIAARPSLEGLRRWALVTRDAHGLYSQFGFTPLRAPDDGRNHISQTSMRSPAPDWVRHALTVVTRKMSEHNMKNDPMYRPLHEVDPQIAAAIDHGPAASTRVWN